MKLRIIVALTNSIALILVFIAKYISEFGNYYTISSIIIDLIFVYGGLFLFVFPVNFCIISLVDALLLVLGEIIEKDCNIAYIRILVFTILLNILVYIIGLHKYNIDILVFPIFICAILCLVYYFSRLDNLKNKKIEMKFKNNFLEGIILGFSTPVVLNTFVDFCLLHGTSRFYIYYEFLILFGIFIFSGYSKIKDADINRDIKLYDFFLGFSISGAVGIAVNWIIKFIVIMALFSLSGGA